MHEVLVAFGTRPEAIKRAPLVHALAADERFEPRVVVTAQHREMLDQVLELFQIEPHLDLGIMTPRQTLAEVTSRALTGLSEAIEKFQPDLVAVQGDTTTTMCGALAAFYQHIPVAHLEAGLRTGDRLSPFPEEINRRITTQLASLHLAPTERSAANLRAEGIAADRVVVTGNTVIDALLWAAKQPLVHEEPALDGLDADQRRVVLVTAHRRESWGAPMRDIAAALAELAGDPRVLVVFPIHKNPLVREAILPAVGGLENVLVVEPVPYGSLVKLLRRADIVLTDSGGIQEEAPSLGKPVLVMRETTERPEGVTAGTAKLVGTDRARIVQEVRTLLEDPTAYAAMANAANPYGDGTAAARTLDAMDALLGRS